MATILRNKTYRIILFTVIVLLGVASSILVCVLSYYSDDKLIRIQFNEATENRYSALVKELDSNLAVLTSVQALYYSSKKDVSRSEFGYFTSHFLKQHADIQALEWVPRVPGAQRAAYEKAGQREGFPDFQFTERMAQGTMKRAKKRTEYFPVYFVEPYKGNELALGFDLASNPIRLEALKAAIKTGEMFATARITLVQEIENQFGFIVFAPIYRKGALINSEQARWDNLEGFALGVFRIGDIVEKALNYYKPEGVDIFIYDASAPAKDRYLYTHASRTRTALLEKEQPETGFKTTRTLEVAGRKWLIIYSATPHFIAARRSWYPWGGLLGGLVFTSIVAGFLFVSDRHAEHIEKSARDLSEANTNLAHEIMEHTQAEEKLREKEHLLSEAQRRGHLGSFLYDMTGPIHWSDELYRLYGVSPDTFIPTVESFINLIHPDDRSAMQAWIAACAAGEKPDALDFRIIMPDGTTHFIRGWGEAVYDAGDKLLHMAGMAQDITERKRAEEALQRYSSELAKNNIELQRALAKVRTLSGMLPICASCKKIRDDKGYWSGVEAYITEHSEAVFSHGLCPDCAKKGYEELDKLKKNKT